MHKVPSPENAAAVGRSSSVGIEMLSNSDDRGSNTSTVLELLVNMAIVPKGLAAKPVTAISA
ncbi:MAG: hypothetical protein WAL04_10740, partial [Acidimicrobiales bacterium]